MTTTATFQVFATVTLRDDGTMTLDLTDYVDEDFLVDSTDPDADATVAAALYENGATFAAVTVHPTDPDRYETDIAELVAYKESTR